MSTVSAVGTTFNLPNYHGQLFVVTPTETPFLSAIGGLGGAKMTTATTYEWQTQDRRTSTANNVALEGQAAPAGSERSRTNVDNIVEIHQSAIEISYSRLGAVGNFAGANIASQADDAVLDELQNQTMAELESMAVDIEQSFLNGIYNKPTDNTTARQTRGILSAIQTNRITQASVGSGTIVASTGVITSASAHGLVVGSPVYLGGIATTTGITNGVRYYALTVPSSTTFTLSATPGGAALTLTNNGTCTSITPAVIVSKAQIDNALQTAFGNGAKLPSPTTVLMMNQVQKVKLSNAYALPALSWPTADRTVGGVAMQTLVTDFGTFGVMIDRWMPVDQIAIIDLSVCSPVFLNIPSKGLLFVEELAQTGATRKFQLYGEVGLEYGPETYHGLITELA
jgi:hypothetical protein